MVNKDEILSICNQYGINYYKDNWGNPKRNKITVNADGTISVIGNIDLTFKELTELPVSFKRVNGYFWCTGNKITSTKGFPQVVTGSFYCNRNHLTSLVGGPMIVGGFYNCSENWLSTLEGSPVVIQESFDCDDNRLFTLEHCPIDVAEDFHCSGNRLSTLVFMPKKIRGEFHCKSRLMDNFNSLFSPLTSEQQHIVLKYMKEYDVWTPLLDVESLEDLIADIKDGLE